MEAVLSAYWVKFFKAAGFSPDVATRHALVFSNNRIQPDMLPDLDKPSLKEMGITLMGDMIAILRYAKKVVEDTTCERFLVDSKDLLPSSKASPAKPIAKKVITKVPAKVSTAPKSQVQIQQPATKVSKIQSSAIKTAVPKKKVATTTTRAVSKVAEKEKPSSILKRKLDIDTIEIVSGVNDKWAVNESRKRLKTTTNDDDDVGYTVIMPKGLTTLKSQKVVKKALDPKRTVFDRLGDSSVTSTTSSSTEGSATTFNVTGLGKDVFKRNSNVFNRLGDRESKKEEPASIGILKNGSTNSSPNQGVFKGRVSTSRVTTTTASTKQPLSTKPVPKLGRGTMRADFEKKQKGVSDGVKKLITTNKIRTLRSTTLTAKQRLGTSKQVTFNKVATVARDKKPDVFSRLGI